jgi:hypothetical protein
MAGQGIAKFSIEPGSQESSLTIAQDRINVLGSQIYDLDTSRPHHHSRMICKHSISSTSFMHFSSSISFRRRVGREFYWRCYPVQAQAMDYSQLAFPAYRFILPEVLADDWLATVGWHKFNRANAVRMAFSSVLQ